ncbi:hypothetical protein BUALT_Bualt07G0153300 [Buddleja alternifolia]|uniref:Uncharacterized protein n=1 Tax=Buddleja alternifolia TaxID=168488 RepID=A0AAV6XAD2_9LAMI|nr:hypothetical protein BUALT_Bualt07G0153300 [Buddleja alternifolia]
MKSGKDEGKIMNPLFPRLHISDADKGGPKAPPRNKMALCDNVHSETPRFMSGLTPIRPSKSRGSFAQRVSSSNVRCPQQKILPTFCSLPPRSSHLTERYHSYYSSGVNLNASRTNSEPRTSEPHTFNNCYIKRPGGEDGFQKSSYVESVMARNHGNQSSEHQRNQVKKRCTVSPDIEMDAEKPTPVSPIGDKVSVLKSVNHHKHCSFKDERIRSFDRYAESKTIRDVMSGVPERIMRKRCFSTMDGLLQSFPNLGDKNGLAKIEMIEQSSEDIINGDKRRKDSDTSVSDSEPGPEITPDDVVGVIGQKLFYKARKIIVHQQRTFAMQIFELHRLIKVQKLIAGSPDMLQESNFNLNEPSIKFPPIDKLLYVTPLDPSPVVTKPKPDALKPNLGQGQLGEANNDENGYPKPSPKPEPIPNTKPAPWCFNQWLIPVKSPSEGLIYKPHTGPCPSAVSIMGPDLGNCGPIGLSTTAYGVPAPKSYFQPYPMPLINTNLPNIEVDQTIPFHEPAVPDKTSFGIRCRNSSNRLSQQDSSGSSLTERFQGDALSLFPTTPSFQGTTDQRNEQKVQVIKVVPHNRKSAPESAARIFRSIQEERNRL